MKEVIIIIFIAIMFFGLFTPDVTKNTPAPLEISKDGQTVETTESFDLVDASAVLAIIFGIGLLFTTKEMKRRGLDR
jgi:hypothetical protein